MTFILKPGELTLSDLHLLLNEKMQIELHPDCISAILASEKVIERILQEGKTAYGINTGFGALASTKIRTADLTKLQESIVLSHAAGVGTLLDDQTVRLILLLKINSLARGFSGVRLKTVMMLIQLFNAPIYPCIPSQGSVGASGDLAPLAHMSAVLMGYGNARFEGKILSAEAALAKIHLKPIELAPKEGLALLNGTQVSTALALKALFASDTLFTAAITAGALSVDAAAASIVPFDARIQQVRGHTAQIKVASILRELLAESEIVASHRDCDKVQDPYSLRCQPQVMGACLAQLHYCSHVLLTEANAVSDNPLIFSTENEILSGGNFHAEPVALVADAMAVSIAEIGALSERRIALLIDPNFSGLPPFLVKEAGVNSGFMLAQVTAAALASENKSLAHPASVDSIPTSANQEDHVSMATFAARRLGAMVENVTSILAIELLAACQGIDFRRPLKTSPRLEKMHAAIRSYVRFYEKDRYFAEDIAKMQIFIQAGQLSQEANIPSVLL